jgi:magnesium dechelatase
MVHLDPSKLHVSFIDGIRADAPITPRAYTLTHSDVTGELFLTIGFSYNRIQISGLYTRFMRDEVLAQWKEDGKLTLHVHCHVSGGLVFGFSRWRDSIFRYHLPMVLEAFRYGDQHLVNAHPQLARAPIIVHFHAWQKRLNRSEVWGIFDDYRLPS